MRALVLLSLLVAAPAFADDTFEAKAGGAQRIGRIENLVWTLTASCDAGDDTQQRQCRRVRDTRATELAGATLIVDADKDAFDVGAWNAQKKSLPIKLAACIRCGGVEIDGTTYRVTVGKEALYDNAKQFPDEAAAKAFAKSASNARVQMLVKVPANPRSVVDGKHVVSLELVGYRVYSACDGTVVIASPASGPATPDKKQCGAIAQGSASAAEVDVLTKPVIDEAMKPVVEAANACFAKFGVAGKAKLKLTVIGDGAVTMYDQQGDFAGTPTGACIDTAVTKAAFPRSKKPKTSISYPIQLQ